MNQLTPRALSSPPGAIHGSHRYKWIDVYRIREYKGEQSTFSGTFDFGKNMNNPQSIVESFVQDTWKISHRFTGFGSAGRLDARTMPDGNRPLRELRIKQIRLPRFLRP